LQDRAAVVIGSDDVAVGEDEAQERSGFGVWREGDRHYLDGKDISEQMIRLGLARDCPRYSGGRYEQAELDAAEQGATIRATYSLPDYCKPR
jgi:hypothetical protein